MTKRIFILLLLLLLLPILSSFTACNKAKKEASTTESDASVTTQAQKDNTSEPEDEDTEKPVVKDFYGNEDDFELTFYDDFDGTELDMTKWSYCPDWERGNVGGRWDKSMISLDGNGNLIVTSSYLTNADGSITPISGAIRTMGKFEQCKGFFEIRCKLQKAHGFWFAFWLMCEGEKNITDGIINGAEMDIVEAFDVDKGLVNHALHWDGYGEHLTSIGMPEQHREVYDGEYHTFSLLWNDEGYIFYVDGELSNWVRKSHGNFPGICEVPTYLKITSEFGTWSSMYDTDELPDSVIVDYVKVYKEK